MSSELPNNSRSFRENNHKSAAVRPNSVGFNGSDNNISSTSINSSWSIKFKYHLNAIFLG